MASCKNCGHPVTGNYCSHCGQKTHLERFTFAFIWHQVFHFFTHIESGFWHTTFRMLIHPGQTVVEYIGGKRKPHQPPVSYFLIWTSAFILALYALIRIFGENTVIDYQDYFGPGASTAFAISNLSTMLTLIIPVQALYFYLLITRPRYNYTESLIMMIYVVGTIIVLQFIFAILALLYFLLTGKAVNLQVSDLFKGAYFIWFGVRIANAVPVRQGWIRMILFILLAAGTFTAWRILAVPSIASFFTR